MAATSALRTGRGFPTSLALRCRVRLTDGRTFTGELPAIRHRALQIGMLHTNDHRLHGAGMSACAPAAGRKGPRSLIS